MTPQPKPSDLLKDPNFTGLPMAEQRKVLGRLDPNYAALPLAEQNKVLGSTGASGDWEAAPQKPKTTSEKIARVGAGAMDTLFPGHDQGKTRGERFLHGAEGAVKGLFDLGGMNGDLLPTDREGKPRVDVTGGVGQLIREDPYRAAGQALPYAASALTGGEVNLAGRAERSGSAAEAIANKIPEAHPTAKLLAKQLPMLGSAVDVLDWFKQKFGSKLDAVPKAGRDELANQLYKEAHGVEPKTATERVNAIKELREKLKTPRATPAKPVKVDAEAPERAARVEPTPKAETPPKAEAPKSTAPTGPVGRANVLYDSGLEKNRYLSARFAEQGLTPEQVEAMPDSKFEMEMLKEGQELVKRGLRKQGFTKYKGGAAQRPYNIMKLEVADEMRKAAGGGGGQ